MFGSGEGETVRAATSDAVTTGTSRPIMSALLFAVFRRGMRRPTVIS
jgi:hypothetical protein